MSESSAARVDASGGGYGSLAHGHFWVPRDRARLPDEEQVFFFFNFHQKHRPECELGLAVGFFFIF